ncbi:unnamed protein product [marine sediment metagenome]|uniref:Uncharacterized protein n=1 Tax=marine sediment metagenome TaxID=412755 RepID=X0RSJ5_9ZZZZ
MNFYGYTAIATAMEQASTGSDQPPTQLRRPDPEPASPHGFTAPAGVDPRLSAWLDEQEKRARRRKKRLKKQRQEARKVQNQPWFWPTVTIGGTLLLILSAAAFRGR